MVGNFGMLSRLRAFLDVVEIVEPEAEDLARLRHRQTELQTLERAARRGRRALRDVGERRYVAIVRGERRAEIGRHLGVHRLQVDHLVALDDAQPQSAFRLEADDLHERSPSFVHSARPREAGTQGPERISLILLARE